LALVNPKPKASLLQTPDNADGRHDRIRNPVMCSESSPAYLLRARLFASATRWFAFSFFDERSFNLPVKALPIIGQVFCLQSESAPQLRLPW
jgi:hypothetical protein